MGAEGGDASRAPGAIPYPRESIEEAAMAIDTRHRPEVALVDRLPRKLLIGGQWVDAQPDAPFETVDPAPGEVLATLPAGTAADVDRAVRAARAAFEESWRDLSPVARGRCLLRLADLID